MIDLKTSMKTILAYLFGKIMKISSKLMHKNEKKILLFLRNNKFKGIFAYENDQKLFYFYSILNILIYFFSNFYFIQFI